MGLINVPGKESVYDMFDEPEEQCFYCDKVLGSTPTLLWMGSTGFLRLHPNCFMDLTTRLFRDYHELQCKTTSLTGL